MDYDLIIVGAGPCGIFTAMESKKIDPSKKNFNPRKGQLY